MTEFTLPPVVVDHDENWIAVDLDGDLGDWARQTARDIMSRMPGHRGRRTEKHMVSVLEAAGAIARKDPGTSIALLLAPDVHGQLKALVRFCPVDLAGRDEDEAWPELLSALSTDDHPDVTELPASAGPCRRIRALYSSGEQGPERPVGEHVNYVWILPRWGAAVIMAASFEDLLEAGRWRPDLDKLAAGVGLEAETGPAKPSGMTGRDAQRTSAGRSVTGLSSLGRRSERSPAVTTAHLGAGPRRVALATVPGFLLVVAGLAVRGEDGAISLRDRQR